MTKINSDMPLPPYRKELIDRARSKLGIFNAPDTLILQMALEYLDFAFDGEEDTGDVLFGPSTYLGIFIKDAA